MIQERDASHDQRKHVDQDAELPAQDQNNIGTVGFVDYKRKEGKGSFKNIGKLAKKKPNEEGIAENEENHQTIF
jgi:hypothetical protein